MAFVKYMLHAYSTCMCVPALNVHHYNSLFYLCCAEMTAYPLLKASLPILTFATIVVIVFLYIYMSENDVPRSPRSDFPLLLAHRKTPRATNVTVFVENFDGLNEFYGNTFTKMESDIPRTCKLPHGGSCILQHSEASAQTSDVVFRMVRFIHPEDTVRYHEGQLLAVINTEAERGEYGLQQLREADIKIDHHPSSEVMWAEMCGLPLHKWATSPPPDPTQRKGIAMFTSNCGAKWRLDYLDRLAKAVSIDSYGGCLHNKDEPPAADGNKVANLAKISSKYRMVVTFENIIQDDYISEKIIAVFSSGAIPVYWGPPQVYSWVPGNHSFIDASKYKDSPEDLAKYLKRVDEEDDLFKYHTSNFDINKTKEKIERLCSKGSPYLGGYICLTCQIAQQKLLQRAGTTHFINVLE